MFVLKIGCQTILPVFTELLRRAPVICAESLFCIDFLAVMRNDECLDAEMFSVFV